MKNQKGFTLIELILYVGLTAILLTSMSQVFLAVVGIRLESQNTTSVQQDGRYIIARMTYDIRRAKSIVTPELGQTLSGMALVIEEDGVDVLHTYAVSGDGDVMLASGSSSAQLNSAGARVAELFITRLGNSGSISDANDTLKIALTLEDVSEVNAGAQRLELQSTVGLR